jgi:hypothetical protein
VAVADVPHKPEPIAEVAPAPEVPVPAAAQAVTLPAVSSEPVSDATVAVTQEGAGASSAVSSGDAVAPTPVSGPMPVVMADPGSATPAPAEESKVELFPEEPVVAAPPPTTQAPSEVSASVSAEASAPETSASPTEAPIESETRAVPPAPVELPPMPAGEMEVSSNWDGMEQGGADASVSQAPTSPWERRAIEVDFSSSDASSAGSDAAFQGGEVPLASVHEFIPSWQPSAEPQAGGAYAGGGWAGSSLSTENADARHVQFQEALEALRQATTRGALGKALLSYCHGRFPRGFLLGETFGFARVGRAYGAGSDKYAVSALHVDLEAPSILAKAAADGRPIVSSVPESQEDEVLFGALGESFSHLLAAPIRLNQRTMGFVVIDGGPSPFGTEELQELEQLITEASAAYGRLLEPSM